jgi:predicted site-specific integrase-resolvase
MELKLLSVQAAAAHLGIHTQIVYRAAQAGDLECVTIDGSPAVLFTQAALDTWVAKREAAGNPVVVDDEDDMVSCAEIAEAAGVTTHAVAYWIRSGKVVGKIVRGKWRVPLAEARRVAREKGFLQQLEDLERRRRVA